MSVGGPADFFLNYAVSRTRQMGVLSVVAAGNEDQDACNTSPASSSDALTVGATDIDDSRAYFSNWGTCVDIFAPGVNIMSTMPDQYLQYLSGTSMATPLVAGLAAYLASYDGVHTPDDITYSLMRRTTS